MAVRRAGVVLSAPWARMLVDRSLRDRSAQVRRIALRLLADSLPTTEVVQLSEAALLDEAAGLRWEARIARLKAGPIDFAGFYRARLANAVAPREIRAALLGLGESSGEHDVPLVRPYLNADSPSVRRVAMRALGQLEPLAVVDPFFVALCDPLPGVATEARRALVDRVAYVRIERVLGLLVATAAPAHTRANALALGRRLSKWDALLVVLTALDEGNPLTAAILDAARNSAANWLAGYNRTFVPPTSEQLTAIESAAARAQLTEGAKAELLQLLGFSRRAWGV